MLNLLDERLEDNGRESGTYANKEAQEQHDVLWASVCLQFLCDEIEEGYLLPPEVYGVEEMALAHCGGWFL